MEDDMKTRTLSVSAILALLCLLSSGQSKAAPGGPFFPIQERGRWGYIDQQGTVVIKPRFEKAGNFSEGLARVKVDGSWGYVDQTFNIRIKPRFQEVHDFSEGLAAVQIDDRWGYINRQGELVIAFTGTYERVTDFS